MKYLAILLAVGFSSTVISNDNVLTINAFDQVIVMPENCKESTSKQSVHNYICDIENEYNVSLIRLVKFDPKRIMELSSEDYITSSSKSSNKIYNFYDFIAKLDNNGQPIDKLFSFICQAEKCLIISSKNKKLIAQFKSQFSLLT
ncbi:MAG: hypothetical protein HRT53_18300 [Colwellia sp.]|nr:hypothetical protein [Colwellia sp.]